MIHRRSYYTKPFKEMRVRMLSTGILEAGKKCVVVTLTSRVRKEGVTTVALGISSEIASADTGKVLLIEASAVGRRFSNKLKATQVLINEITSGDSHSDYIYHSEKLNIDVLSIKKAPDNTKEYEVLLESLLIKLRKEYRYIIVDTGALQASVPYAWARCSDHAALVFNAMSTTEDMLERFNSEFANSSIKFSGFIMNRRPFHIPKFLYRLIY